MSIGGPHEVLPPRGPQGDEIGDFGPVTRRFFAKRVSRATPPADGRWARASEGK